MVSSRNEELMTVLINEQDVKDLIINEVIINKR